MRHWIVHPKRPGDQVRVIAMPEAVPEWERLGYRVEGPYASVNGTLSAEDLHRAAARVPEEPALLDQLATAGAQFMEESQIWSYEKRSDPQELLEAMAFDPRAFGYGVLIGYLAATDE